jgi:hypothetical protein
MAADVLTFDASRRRTLRSGATGGPGNVLMFSGVRYERPDERASESSAPAGTPADPMGGSNPPRRM